MAERADLFGKPMLGAGLESALQFFMAKRAELLWHAVLSAEESRVDRAGAALAENRDEPRRRSPAAAVRENGDESDAADESDGDRT
jgi:hypothetical protein